MASRKRKAKRTRPGTPALRKVTLQSRVAPGAVYKRVCEIALALPGVEQSTSYGTPSLKVKGKIMSRLRTEAEGALALRCDFLDRQILLQADPEAFFLTDHYLNYPMVLVRLDKVRRSALPDLIERAWRMVAPPRLVTEYDRKRKT
ncbi:MAG: MmcQ/YjbR family DNA-binding protein [Gammaproteobacteria bacterium]